MALKAFVFVYLLVASMALAAPKAEAQLGGLGGLGGLTGLLSLLKITGKIFCTLDGNIGINGTATPVFPNALVQLQCGTDNNVVSTTTTNDSGIFSIVLDPLQAVLSSLLSNCSIAVKTPLSTCNTSLPSVGGLVSPLKYVGNTLFGLLNITNLIPGGFSALTS